MFGSRTRRGGRGGGVGPTAIVLLVAVAVLAMAGPAGSFTLGTLPRSGGSDVVADVDGTLGLDVAASVQKRDQTARLVTVTNQLGVSVTVTVTVTNSNRHDLYLGGTNYGSQATFSLADGTSQRVNVDAHPREASVVFDVGATGTGITVNANGRSSTVV